MRKQKSQPIARHSRPIEAGKSLGRIAIITSKKSKYATKYAEDFLTLYNRIDPTSRLSVFRMRLKNALEIEHMAIFFRVNAYFQIKSNEDMIKPDIAEC